MLFPWNLVSLHRFKRISLFLFLRGNSVLCSCSCILFAHIWGERQLAWFSLMLWFPLALWQEEPAEYLQKASLNSTELALRLYSIFPFAVLLCKDFSGEPLDTCPVSSGAGGTELREVHRQKVMGLLAVQRCCLVGLAGSCVQEQMSKCKLSGSCCAVSHSWGPAKLTTAHWYTFAGQMPQHQCGNNNIA